jgi:hypothetical protein
MTHREDLLLIRAEFFRAGINQDKSGIPTGICLTQAAGRFKLKITI